jgi:hypothetical protein
MATKYETLVSKIGETEVTAENAADVAAQFINVIAAVGNREELDAVIEMPQYGALETEAPDEHVKAEDAWLAKNKEFESPAKKEPAQNNSAAGKKVKEPKEPRAKTQKPVKASAPKAGKKAPEAHKEAAKKPEQKKAKSASVAKAQPSHGGGGILTGETDKVVAWVDFLKGEVKAKQRTMSWKECLIEHNISQPYSHKVRQCREDIKELCAKWNAMENVNEPAKEPRAKSEKPVSAKAADKKSAKQKAIEEANKARIKKANEKKNGMKNKGKSSKK